MRNARPRFGRMSAVVSAVITAAVVVVAGCTGVNQARGAERTPPTLLGSSPLPVTIAEYYRQKLDWQPCSARFQCARLLVPVDYRHPAGRRFSLPVVRLLATDPAHRIGSIVLNPGGPGGSGVQYAMQARSVLAAPVLARFDVVGFDPRGVGGASRRSVA